MPRKWKPTRYFRCIERIAMGIRDRGLRLTLRPRGISWPKIDNLNKAEGCLSQPNTHRGGLSPSLWLLRVCRQLEHETYCLNKTCITHTVAFICASYWLDISRASSVRRQCNIDGNLLVYEQEKVEKS